MRPGSKLDFDRLGVFGIRERESRARDTRVTRETKAAVACLDMRHTYGKVDNMAGIGFGEGCGA
eukprot:scaffold2269_cov221-Pinguiococcus_pyrenoidosus.AAC.10